MLLGNDSRVRVSSGGFQLVPGPLLPPADSLMGRIAGQRSGMASGPGLRQRRLLLRKGERLRPRRPLLRRAPLGWYHQQPLGDSGTSTKRRIDRPLRSTKGALQCPRLPARSQHSSPGQNGRWPSSWWRKAGGRGT